MNSKDFITIFNNSTFYTYIRYKKLSVLVQKFDISEFISSVLIDLKFLSLYKL